MEEIKVANRTSHCENQANPVAVVVDPAPVVVAEHHFCTLVLHPFHVLHLIVVGEAVGVQAPRPSHPTNS